MALDVELSEIRDFLARHAPFDTLPPDVLGKLPRKLAIEYYRRGRSIITRGRDNHSLFILRSGAVDVRDDQDLLVDKGEPGDAFGAITLTRRQSLGLRGEHDRGLVVLCPARG
jgi:Predicted signal-transduction protein containing cAMP-binding and CBS domains